MFPPDLLRCHIGCSAMFRGLSRSPVSIMLIKPVDLVLPQLGLHFTHFCWLCQGFWVPDFQPVGGNILPMSTLQSTSAAYPAFWLKVLSPYSAFIVLPFGENRLPDSDNEADSTLSDNYVKGKTASISILVRIRPCRNTNLEKPCGFQTPLTMIIS